jgi:tetratricopeptide (TPR) repeat protein
MHAPAAMLAGHVAAEGGEVARLVPRLASRVPDVPAARASDPDTERFLLFRAVAALLGAAATDDAVVLVLDDIQWADRQSLSLLRFLAAEQVPGLAIAATYRSTELSPDHPLTDVLAQLHRQAEPVRVALDGLDQAEVVALLEGAAGHELDADGLALARALGDETSGNPFFVGEMLRHLAEIGQLRREGDRWIMAGDLGHLSLPQGVRAVVLQRAGRLSAGAQGLLSVASVAGRDFDLDVVAEVGRLEASDALAAVEEAVRAALVHEVAGRPGRFTFAHAIVEHSLVEAQSAARQRVLHRSIAEALEARGHGDVAPAVLAQHWVEGYDASTLSVAIDRAGAAGDHALAQLAPDEAIRWYETALQLLDASPHATPHDRAEILAGLGSAQRSAGHADHLPTLQRAAELAQSAGDARLVARAALGSFKGIWSANAGIDTERIAMLEAALAGLDVADAALRSRVLAALAVEHFFDETAVDERGRLSEEAIALARAAGDDSALAFALQARDSLIRTPDRLAERRRNSAELGRLAQRLGDPAQQFWAAHAEVIVAHEEGDPARFYAAVDEMVALGERTGQPFLRMFAGFMRATVCAVQGDRAGAEAAGRQSMTFGDEAGEAARARTYFAAITFLLRRDAGQLEDVVEVLQRAVQANSRITSFRPALGLVLAELGRTDELDEFHRDVAESFAGHPRNTLWFSSMAMNAEIAAYTGHRAAAAQLYDVLEPFAGLLIWSGIGAYGPAARPLGLAATTLGRFDDADRHFATAAVLAERFGAPVWLARTQQEWAAMLLCRRGPGDRERAGPLLDDAEATALRLDLRLIASRAAALRDAAG